MVYILLFLCLIMRINDVFLLGYGLIEYVLYDDMVLLGLIKYVNKI